MNCGLGFSKAINVVYGVTKNKVTCSKIIYSLCKKQSLYF